MTDRTVNYCHEHEREAEQIECPEMEDFDQHAFLARVYQTCGIAPDPGGPRVVHVKVVLQIGPESFAVAEDDLTEDAYRTQLVDLLRAAALELEDG